MLNDVISLGLAVGALVHILIAVLVILFRYGPNWWIGAWLVVAWALGLLRALEIRQISWELFTDWWAAFVWGNIIVAAIFVLVSMVRNAARHNFIRRAE